MQGMQYWFSLELEQLGTPAEFLRRPMWAQGQHTAATERDPSHRPGSPAVYSKPRICGMMHAVH